MNKCILIVIVFLTHTFLTSAQSVVENIEKLSPMSPEAASLAKAVQFPVSYFTGSPNVSVPLYNIDEGRIQIPLNLSYNYSGLKVTEEASWVGLGWTLNAGGSITRVVKGKWDNGIAGASKLGAMEPYISNSTEFNDYREVLINKYEGQSLCQYRDENGNYVDHMTDMVYHKNNIDGEYDLFMYNFPGYSGKFIIDNGNFHDLSNNDIVFEALTSPEEGYMAITPDGLVFKFMEAEYSQTVSLGSNTIARPFTYFLSEIIDPYDPNNVVYYNYESFDDLTNPGDFGQFPGMNDQLDTYVPQLPSIYEHYVKSSYSQGGHTVSFSSTSIDLKFLDEIVFRKGKISFSKMARADLYGYRVSNISIYNHDQANPIKEFDFLQTYFTTTSNLGGNSLTTSPSGGESMIYTYPQQFIERRLRLDGVVEKSGPLNGRVYSFDYDETNSMPYKTSFAQDYWGYYNGWTGRNNTTLIPDMRRYLYHESIPHYMSSWQGANREQSESYMKTGILTSFTHPTKGKTTFDYEINEYENAASVQGGSFLTPAPQVDVTDRNQSMGTIPYEEFEIVNATNGQKGPVDVSVNMICDIQGTCINGENNNSACGNGYGTSNGNGMYVAIMKWNGGNKSLASSWDQLVNHTWDVTKLEIRECSSDGEPWSHSYTTTLDNGTYRAYASYPDNKGAVNQSASHGAYITVDYFTVAETSYESTNDRKGGGLRLASMTNEDPVSGQSITTDYEYEGGIMLRFPMFHWRTPLVVPDVGSENECDGCPVGKLLDNLMYLYGQTVIPYSFASGSFVGYEKVTESVSGNGKTEYNYFVQESKLDYRLFDEYDQFLNGDPKQYISGTETTPYMLNGSLEMVEVFEEGNPNAIKRVENTYSVVNGHDFWNTKYYAALNDPDYDTDYCNWLFLNHYPVIQGKVVQISSKTTEFYDDGTEYESYSTTQYDSKNHSLATGSSETTSEGNSLHTINLYSHDFPDSDQDMKDLKDNNFLVPIENVSYQEKDGNLSILGGQTYNYYTDNIKMGLPSYSYSLELSEPIPLNEFKFSNQNSSGVIPFVDTQNSYSYDPDDAYGYSKNYWVKYNDIGNIVEYDLKDGTYGTFIYGFDGALPIATATLARTGQISYTSFEDDGGTGGWIYDVSNGSEPCADICADVAYDALEAGCANDAAVSCEGQPAGCYELAYSACMGAGTSSTHYTTAFNLCNSTCDDQVNPIEEGGVTGTKHFVGDNRSILRTLNSTGEYVVACWAMKNGTSGTISVNGADTFINSSNWEYVEIPFTATTTSLTLDLDEVLIDELRLYPKGAKMKTFLHEPMIGVKATSDANGTFMTYEYDELGRLILVRDHDGYILKENKYNYK